MNQDGKHEGNPVPKKKKHTARNIVLVLVFIFVVLPIGLVVWASIAMAREQHAVQAKIAADPVTISGIYNALNKQRAVSGAPALSTLQNLTTAAEQHCSDMVAGKYFEYKNPTTGKDINERIAANAGDLYLKTYNSSLFSSISGSQTATDAVNGAIAKQATTLNNPEFNSVGWAVCQSPTNPAETYIVGVLADNEPKPVAPPPAAVRYVSPSVPRHCTTTYNDYGGYLNPTATTNCY